MADKMITGKKEQSRSVVLDRFISWWININSSYCLIRRTLLVEMTFGLVNASFSVPKWQAVKLTFFAPCVILSSSQKKNNSPWPLQICLQLICFYNECFLWRCYSASPNLKWMSKTGSQTIIHCIAGRSAEAKLLVK